LKLSESVKRWWSDGQAIRLTGVTGAVEAISTLNDRQTDFDSISWSQNLFEPKSIQKFCPHYKMRLQTVMLRIRDLICESRGRAGAAPLVFVGRQRPDSFHLNASAALTSDRLSRSGGRSQYAKPEPKQEDSFQRSNNHIAALS
jgi:hypothetical protein